LQLPAAVSCILLRWCAAAPAAAFSSFYQGGRSIQTDGCWACRQTQWRLQHQQVLCWQYKQYERYTVAACKPTSLAYPSFWHISRL
jgi:hypothetical protein